MAKLPILMYHDVSETTSKALTISVIRLEEQLKWLSDNGYTSWHFAELQQMTGFPTKKNVVITFDDAYVSQMKLAAPLLQKYNLKATFFVPLGYLGKTDEWNTGTIPIMTSDQLEMLDPKVIELGYHSYYHKKYNELTELQMVMDHDKCVETLTDNDLRLVPALAYPYGKFPKEAEARQSFFEMLNRQGFNFGLRIGNRVNKFPFRERFVVQRLDIKGEYSLKRFKRKIRFGKLF